MNNLFDQIVAPENVAAAYHRTQLGQPKYKVAAILFDRERKTNLNKLVDEVVTGSYRPSQYHRFTVYEPKERVIYAPSYRDKIVQHMTNNILAPYFKQTYIVDSYACITGRGNTHAVDTLVRYLRRAQWLYGAQAYLVKTDVARFFYSMCHDTLKHLLHKQIPCPRTYALLARIIDGSPESPGLPLGNLTSQLFANVYMNPLDQFCKRQLGLRFYLRYADDMFAICPNKTEAREALRRMVWFTKDRLKLKLHPLKSTVLPITKGLDALGFKIYPTHLLLKRASKLRIKRYLRQVPKRLTRGVSVLEVEQRLNGWLNYASRANIYNFLQYLLARYPYLGLKTRRLFYIKPNWVEYT